MFTNVAVRPKPFGFASEDKSEGSPHQQLSFLARTVRGSSNRERPAKQPLFFRQETTWFLSAGQVVDLVKDPFP